jgi:hypothetical protein
VPPLDRVLTEPPAEADLPAAHERGKVDEPRLDVAQRDPQPVQPQDRRLHLVDDALHAEPDPAQLGVLGGVLAPAARCARSATVRGRLDSLLSLEDLVAQPDELGPLIAQRAQDLAQLR